MITTDISKKIKQHQSQLKNCNSCEKMSGPPVTGEPVISSVMLVGQAPGFKEIEVHRPFAWTAGKTLFKWFGSIGVEEHEFRHAVYMAAVCRCYPGKKQRGGDRVPDKEEIKNCSGWLHHEIDLLKPQLIIPVGKLAINQFISFKKLTEVIGQQHQGDLNGIRFDIVPLPHPSGVSTWHVTEPGKTLLKQALGKIQKHESWRTNFLSGI